MNGKSEFSDVKNETPYNIPLVLEENVISSGITLISLWHTLADEQYRISWPKDKMKPLIANSWVAIYTVKGCGKIVLNDDSEITLNGNCVIFLKPINIKAYFCEGLLWEQYWMEFIPNGAMEIPLRQPAMIYQGEIFNQELRQVSQLIASPKTIENNLAVAFIAKLVYQWICLIDETGTKDRQLIAIEKLLSDMHADMQRRWTVMEMAEKMQCSEQYLRRLFLKYTGKSPKEYYLDARLDLALALLRQQRFNVGQVADMLNFFDSFHFSKSFKARFGYAPSGVINPERHRVRA